MDEHNDKKYANFSNARNIHQDLIPEEYPEGAYGSPIRSDQPVYGKSTSWKEGQRRQSPFAYSYREIHKDLPRQAPGAHPVPRENDHNEKQ